MGDRSFIITAIQPWDAKPVSDIHFLASELSKRAKVLYVNPPSDMLSLVGGAGRIDADRRSRVLDGSEPVLRHVSRNLWVFEPPVLISQPARIYSDTAFDILNKRNNMRFAETIRWAANYIGFEEFTLMVDNDVVGSQYLDEFLNPLYLAYYRRHDLLLAPNSTNTVKRLERSLITKSDVVFASSRVLAEQVENYNFNTFDIGRGTVLDDFDLGRKRAVPPDIMSIRHPIIGCESTVLGEYTVSADLLYRLAKSYDDCSLVLIGGEDGYFASHKLHSLPNVYFLGSKVENQLPSYISVFDICVCAQPDNYLTRINYPDNIVHYLAMGKSVVANHSVPVRQFASKIHLALDDVEFIGLVGIGLYEGAMVDIPQWASYAQRYVWEYSAERILTVLDLLGYDNNEPEYVLGDYTAVYS